MPSASITVRKTKGGRRRYAVRFRLGGRTYPVEHGGSFPTMREARIRRDLIAGELAAGRNPAQALKALQMREHARLTIAAWGERFLASRLDIDANTSKNYRTALKKVSASFGERDPATITATEVAEWVGALAGSYKPGTVQLYLIALRLLLDYVGLEENPARDQRVKLPKQTREEPQPPTGEQLTAILAAMGERYRLLFVTIEQGALRLGEAVNLRWGDVDFAGLRLRLARARTKTGKARFVYLPEWLLQAIDGTCPLETARPNVRSSRASRRLPPIRRWCEHAKAQGRVISTPMTSATAVSPSGTRAASQRARRAGGSFQALDEPGRLQPRDAGRRSLSGQARGSDSGLKRLWWCGPGVVSRRLVRRGAASLLGAWTSWCSPPPASV
jgi:integrase